MACPLSSLEHAWPLCDECVTAFYQARASPSVNDQRGDAIEGGGDRVGRIRYSRAPDDEAEWDAVTAPYGFSASDKRL